MSNFVWAIDDKGKPTKCFAKPENRGKRNCKHKFHFNNSEEMNSYLSNNKTIKISMNSLPKDLCEYRYESIISNGRGENLILRFPNKGDISQAQVFSYSDGCWMNNPDLWYKAIRMEEEDHIEIEPIEAYNKLKRDTVDDDNLKLCQDIFDMVNKKNHEINNLIEYCDSNLTKSIVYTKSILNSSKLDIIDLELSGVPKTTLVLSSYLEKKNNESYNEYIDRIKNNPIASEVEYCELKYKLNYLEPNNKEYEQALNILNNIYNFERV